MTPVNQPSFCVSLCLSPSRVPVRSASGRGAGREGARVEPRCCGAAQDGDCAEEAGVGARARRLLPARVQSALLVNAVPLLWGSYGPAVRVVEQSVPHMPVLVLNLACYVCAQLSISAARAAAGDASPLPLRAGAELGTYLFAGSVLNLAALSHTSAPRAAVLVQLTTVLVPALSRARGERVGARVWQACALATGGTLLLASGGSAAAAAAGAAGTGAALALNGGDVMALGAAACYSVHVVRLGDVGARPRALALVDAKTRTQLALAALCVLLAPHAPHNALSFVRALTGGGAAALAAGALWVGAVTTTAATCLQVVAQRRVGASRAVVSFASQPVWAALIALALRIDDVSAREALGGALIVLGALLLALSPREL